MCNVQELLDSGLNVSKAWTFSRWISIIDPPPPHARLRPPPPALDPHIYPQGEQHLVRPHK